MLYHDPTSLYHSTTNVTPLGQIIKNKTCIYIRYINGFYQKSI